ncbi:MAG: hypothetical protein JO358_14400 [Alphaproteobacteria bacterium]|nr:hypothetical protein [Alphaproteobacteria bacterium]
MLSGLLRRQDPIVLAPHRGLGIVLERRLVIDGWSTLVVRAAARAQSGIRRDPARRRLPHTGQGADRAFP